MVNGDRENVRVLDENHAPENVDQLQTTVDPLNKTFSVTVKDGDSKELTVLVNSSWLDGLLLEPALADTKYEMETYEGATWYGIRIREPGIGQTLVFEGFRPKADKAAYSRGSLHSVRLERPMFVSVAEVPHLETETVRMSNRNGTWVEEVPKPVNRLGIEFTDSDTTGQTVTLNRSWLGGYGLTEQYFQYEDGTSISNMSDEHHYYLYPSHFSILYVFTNSDGFFKEDYRPYSDVYWDSVNRNIYVLSDRRDPTGSNERVRSPAPVTPITYDQTSSFRLRATWKTSQQGNWQSAAPVFFMGASNSRVDMANSVHVFYYSRDSNLGYSPYYYLRYYDSAGNFRVNYLILNRLANVQYEFLISYDAYTRVMSFAVLDSVGISVASTTYTLGASETFSLGKVGAAAWGFSNTAEPTIIAKTDNIFLEANMARNGNFEIDSNYDGIPDNWQIWIWTSGGGTRSQDRAKYGLWSHKIVDSSTSQAYGLQTAWMSVSPGETYTGSAWVYVSSGSNQLCLEFWTAASGGTRTGVVCKGTSTSLAWEFLDVTMQVPSGAYTDLLVYSSLSNTGTGYFDGAELKRSRSSWSVHVHTNHVPDAATWGTVLDSVTDLGITSVRIDFTWAGFEPSRDVFDWNHVSYWDVALRVIRSRGVGIIAILSGPIPGWAQTLLHGCPGIPPQCPPDQEAFFAEWREFASFIASRYGQDVQYYQLLNEENHFAHSLFEHEHQYGEPRAFNEAYLGLVEGTGLTTATHKSRFKTIVNAFADDLPGGNDWNTWFRDILNDPWGAESIDVVAIDHYPGTWCCHPNIYRDWGAFDTLALIARDYGREAAVMETGYSTHSSPSHDEDDQEAFVNNALDELLVRANGHNVNYPLSSFLIVSWYEIIDACTGCVVLIPQEVNFGIVKSSPPWGQKLAYDDLRYQVSRWK